MKTEAGKRWKPPRKRGGETPTPVRGMGDVVAIVAGPVAKLMDASIGTHLTNCGGCAARRAKLNAMFPRG